MKSATMRNATQPRPRTIAVAVALAGSALFAACGGGGTSGGVEQHHGFYSGHQRGVVDESA